MVVVQEFTGWRLNYSAGIAIVPSSQDADAAQVSRDSADRFPSLPTLQLASLDSLCIPLKVIQERAGHALTGSFTLDVYGGKPECTESRSSNRAVRSKGSRTELFVGLTAVKEERLPTTESEDLMTL